MVNFSEMSKYKYPFYILKHPSDGYQELRYNKKGSLSFSIVIVLFWYISAVSVRQLQEFAFNPTRPGHLNVLTIAASTMLIFAMAMVSNWCFSTLMDGKGTLKDIWIVCSYALIPIIIGMWIRIILSQFLVVDEGVFIQYIDIACYMWAAVLFFLALCNVHEFSYPKTFILILLTALGMLIMVFLFIMVVTLSQQIFMFVGNIFYEIMYRFFS